MEYRFSLTPRLIALTLFCGVSLLVLLFTLGFQVGRQMSGVARENPARLVADARSGMATVSGKGTEIAAAAKGSAEGMMSAPKAAP
ncbi:hypothetical protein [Noviherbaspirillum galbum]|uniref:Uncharacterized protein n=1 Tax=Noviherbaspirillum galbum TaxID=2709383 RepID=A0A6B3SVX2_9BURK|nr:hypothetical protein [Noviherbaspirillum galbum]NEX64804.1 hypothetical protein [Noviherbaspirillum galbum]